MKKKKQGEGGKKEKGFFLLTMSLLPKEICVKLSNYVSGSSISWHICL